MRPLKWTLIRYNWYSLKEGKSGHRDKMIWRDVVKRWPSASQGEQPRTHPSLTALKRNQPWHSRCGSAVAHPTSIHGGHGFNPWPHSVGWGSGIAVSCAMVADVARIRCSWGCGVGCHLDSSTPSLGTSICHRCNPKKQKQKQTNKQ